MYVVRKYCIAEDIRRSVIGFVLDSLCVFLLCFYLSEGLGLE